MTAIQGKPRATRTSRLGIRTTREQEVTLRRAAAIRNKTLTEFVLDSACAMAEETLLDQRLVMVSGREYEEILDLLDQPCGENEGLKRLFSKKAPWE